MVGKLENSSLLGSCDLSVSKTVEQGQNPFNLCCTLPSMPTETAALNKAVPDGLQVQVFFGGRCAKACHGNSLPLLRGIFEGGWLAQPRTLLSNVILLEILTHASWVVEIKPTSNPRGSCRRRSRSKGLSGSHVFLRRSTENASSAQPNNH